MVRMIGIESWILIGFVLLIVLLAIKDRKNIEFKYGVLIRRTRRGKEWIYRMAKKHKKLFKVYGLIGIGISISASLFGIYMLLQNAYTSIIQPQKAVPSVGLVLPQIPGIEYPFPYILGVPISYWIIAILTILFFHETSHALVARAEGIRLKSFGVLLLLIFPGAFVEPDERQLKRSKILKRIKVYAAGSFGNFLVAALVFLISFGLFKLTLLFLEPVGIDYEVIPGTPASEANLSGTILSVNGNRTRNILEFIATMEKVRPGEVVEIETSSKVYRIKTTSHPERPEWAYLGIRFKRNEIDFREEFKFLGKPSSLLISSLEWFFGSPLFSPFNPGLFSWIIMLNFLVGVFNVLPIKPLDGGLIYEAILEKFSKKNAKNLANLLTIFTISIILITIIIPLT